MSAVENADSSILTEDNLERIQKMFPSEKELKNINNTLRDLKRKRFRRQKNVGDAALRLLPPEERLMVRLAALPDAVLRVDLLLFRARFKAEHTRVREMLTTLNSGINAIVSAAHHGQLRGVLALILQLVNMLNQTHEKGFRISTLGKLSQTKMTRGNGSLMDVVAMHMASMDNGQGCFLSELDGVNAAVSIKIKDIEVLVRALSTRTAQTVRYISEHKVPGAEEGFIKAMSALIDDGAVKQVRDLEAALKKCRDDFQRLCKYFLEDEIRYALLFFALSLR